MALCEHVRKVVLPPM